MNNYQANSMISSTITDYWTVSDAIQYVWVKGRGQNLKLQSGLIERNLKARHISLEDHVLAKQAGSIALSLFSSLVWKWIQEVSDRYNTCMWLSGLKVEGAGGSLEGEIRSVGVQTMPHSQRGSRAFMARLNQK